MRTCGDGQSGCTKCCVTHPVLDVHKDRGTQCVYCVSDTGCRLQSQKPKECAKFKCLWLYGAGSEDERPDKTGVVLDSFFSDLIESPAVGMWEATPGAIKNEYAKRMKARFLTKGYPVFVEYLNGDTELTYPCGFTPTLQQKAFVRLSGISITGP